MSRWYMRLSLRITCSHSPSPAPLVTSRFGECGEPKITWRQDKLLIVVQTFGSSSKWCAALVSKSLEAWVTATVSGPVWSGAGHSLIESEAQASGFCWLECLRPRASAAFPVVAEHGTADLHSKVHLCSSHEQTRTRSSSQQTSSFRIALTLRLPRQLVTALDYDSNRKVLPLQWNACVSCFGSWVLLWSSFVGPRRIPCGPLAYPSESAAAPGPHNSNWDWVWSPGGRPGLSRARLCVAGTLYVSSSWQARGPRPSGPWQCQTFASESAWPCLDATAIHVAREP